MKRTLYRFNKSSGYIHVHVPVRTSIEDNGCFVVIIIIIIVNFWFFFPPDSNDKNAEAPGYASRRYMSLFFPFNLPFLPTV